MVMKFKLVPFITILSNIQDKASQFQTNFESDAVLRFNSNESLTLLKKKEYFGAESQHVIKRWISESSCFLWFFFHLFFYYFN